MSLSATKTEDESAEGSEREIRRAARRTGRSMGDARGVIDDPARERRDAGAGGELERSAATWRDNARGSGRRAAGGKSARGREVGERAGRRPSGRGKGRSPWAGGTVEPSACVSGQLSRGADTPPN